MGLTPPGAFGPALAGGREQSWPPGAGAGSVGGACVWAGQGQVSGQLLQAGGTLRDVRVTQPSGGWERRRLTTRPGPPGGDRSLPAPPGRSGVVGAGGGRELAGARFPGACGARAGPGRSVLRPHTRPRGGGRGPL